MPRKKKTTTPATPLNTPTPTASQPTPKVAWDKDGENGITSIRVLLDWLSVDGNFARWCGNKTGSTKQAIANEILALLVGAGITHRNQKGVLTKIQELQSSYMKASDFHHNTGSGLQDNDIANGTHTLQSSGVAQEMQVLGMATRTAANPLHTNESPDLEAPDLLNGRLLASLVPALDGEEDGDEIDRPIPARGSDHPLQTPKRTDTLPDEGEDEPAAVRSRSESPAPQARSGGTKRKAPPRNSDGLGLEKVLGEANEYRRKCFDAREKRDAEKRATEKARMEKEGLRIDNKIKRDQQLVKVEQRKATVLERESQVKIKQNEMAEIRAGITFMKELQTSGHNKKEIKMYMGLLFKKSDAGPSQSTITGSTSANNLSIDSDSDDSSDDDDESSS
ncbi:hypothetical protein PSTG_13927 [Puccinia striiformis f. sp. tritici PST-78]|uniref:Uncharacterized protein n=1 Tax=Puccinia striiformis f. sp. tritici PST-78 TaxID=1165861 RepID=A0A0L0V051_9BASI|nr:hypothetical protein PSTG_13927 [Puccinia striiformis f. sp. tritici PST-78]